MPGKANAATHFRDRVSYKMLLLISASVNKKMGIIRRSEGRGPKVFWGLPPLAPFVGILLMNRAWTTQLLVCLDKSLAGQLIILCNGKFSNKSVFGSRRRPCVKKNFPTSQATTKTLKANMDRSRD